MVFLALLGCGEQGLTTSLDLITGGLSVVNCLRLELEDVWITGRLVLEDACSLLLSPRFGTVSMSSLFAFRRRGDHGIVLMNRKRSVIVRRLALNTLTYDNLVVLRLLLLLWVASCNLHVLWDFGVWRGTFRFADDHVCLQSS